MINQRKNRFLLPVCISAILIIQLLVVSAFSCMAYLGGGVTVYEWVDAPEGATGEIYVDMEAPADRELKPVADASVSVRTETRITDSRGDVFYIYAPNNLSSSASMWNIRVEKEGYKTLEDEFQNFSDEPGYGITVFLVREEP